MNKRRKALINKLNGMGVFYKDGEEIEKITLVELEIYNIERKCEFAKILGVQRKAQLAGNKSDFDKYLTSIK